jgi:solute carrier family 13 (sodium-dependent dicarboxylate transporter), member 2/3/5
VRPIAIAAGPAAFGVVLAAPLPALSDEAHALLGVLAWTVVYWLTEALPVPATALLGSALCVLMGVAPAARVFAAYGDPVILLFVGSFVLAAAMQHSGLDRRLAFALLGRAWARRSTAHLMLALGVVTCALSLWVSNTATTAMMLPVAVGLVRALGATDTPLAIGFPLMTTWASSVAVGIPIASPPNLIAIGMVRDLTDKRLSFFDWIVVTMPLTVVMLVLCWLILRWRYARLPPSASVTLAALPSQPGRWPSRQARVAAVFVATCALWVLPGFFALVAPGTAMTGWLEARLPESVVAVLAAVLLVTLPAGGGERGTLLPWTEAVRIDWGTILLFGGGLALGRLTFETGLGEAAGRLAFAWGTEGRLWTLTAIAIVLGVLLSELASNTAAATVIIPLMIAIASAAGVSPLPPVLGAALGASFGFMLPVSTPPNAIVYGSGLVPLREMVRAGVWLDVTGACVIWLGLRILCPLVGVM